LYYLTKTIWYHRFCWRITFFPQWGWSELSVYGPWPTV